MIEQRTLDWHRERLGLFTASKVGDLMVSGRKKDEIFGETAKSYIDEVTAERLLDPAMVADDFAFENYLNETSHETKAMSWGVAYEDMARGKYMEIAGVEVAEAPSIKHPEMACLSCSPDGMVGTDGLVEIKSPQAKNFLKYCLAIKRGDTMKDINRGYYWQIMCQLAVTGRKWCDFIVYHPYISPTIITLRVERDDEAIAAMMERVRLADEIVSENVKLLKNDEF